MTLDLNLIITLVFAIGFSILVGAWIGFKLSELKSTGSIASSSSPSIVVNVPADWKPLETIPPSQIEGARASLWWSVYHETLNTPNEDSVDATNAADLAVDKVFGPLPKS